MILIAGLAACAFLLFIAQRYEAEGGAGLRARKGPTEADITTDIDSLLQRQHIHREWVKSWQVKTPERRFIRLERRVFVPKGFLSLKFNLELSRMLSKYGARVVATEHARENIVTMHVILSGFIVQTVAFVENPELNW